MAFASAGCGLVIIEEEPTIVPAYRQLRTIN
jgi:hypothetical protein